MMRGVKKGIWQKKEVGNSHSKHKGQNQIKFSYVSQCLSVYKTKLGSIKKKRLLQHHEYLLCFTQLYAPLLVNGV